MRFVGGAGFGRGAALTSHEEDRCLSERRARGEKRLNSEICLRRPELSARAAFDRCVPQLDAARADALRAVRALSRRECVVARCHRSRASPAAGRGPARIPPSPHPHRCSVSHRYCRLCLDITPVIVHADEYRMPSRVRTHARTGTVGLGHTSGVGADASASCGVGFCRSRSATSRCSSHCGRSKSPRPLRSQRPQPMWAAAPLTKSVRCRRAVGKPAPRPRRRCPAGRDSGRPPAMRAWCTSRWVVGAAATAPVATTTRPGRRGDGAARRWRRSRTASRWSTSGPSQRRGSAPRARRRRPSATPPSRG